MTECFDVVAVGAGQASAQLAISLRQGGYGGRVLLIGDEPDPPYERPPLSKDYLAGTRDAARLPLRSADFWRDRGIDLVLGERVVELRPASKMVITTAGRRVSFGNLVWATGGRARRLPCRAATYGAFTACGPAPTSTRYALTWWTRPAC